MIALLIGVIVYLLLWTIHLLFFAVGLVVLLFKAWPYGSTFAMVALLMVMLL